MINIFISLLAIFSLLVINEYFWRKHKIGDELSRKTIHIVVAIFVAFWPYYMSYRQIQLVSISFLIVIILSRYLHIFQGITHVKRKTYGDFFFPIAIFIMATIAPQNIIFTIALLHIGLSDGLAALIGKKYGKNNIYKVFGQTKSLAGTTAFIVISFVILFSANLIKPNANIGLTLESIIVMPIVLVFVENISVYGADDLTIPLVLVAGLKLFQN